MTKLSIIAAIGKNRELGKNNQLLWRLPEDLKRFKKLTIGHPIIMGRKTHESIGRPLPGRLNIVVTRQKKYRADGCTVTDSLDKAIQIARANDQEEIFVIGGAELYAQALPLTDRLYLTLVDAEAEADVFFPAYDDFNTVIDETALTPTDPSYKYLTLEK